jgi:hypothetical protein
MSRRATIAKERRMRAFVLALTGLALAAAPTATALGAAAEPGAHPAVSRAAVATDWSSARRKRVKRPRSVGSDRARPTRIACTRTGCHPVPSGCHVVMEHTWDDMPTGFEIIICPRR